MEITNVSVRGPRKGKPKPSKRDLDMFFAVLRKMPLRVHHQGLDLFLDQAVPLMVKYKLTSYDTAFLMLAKSMGLPLATNDGKMRDAAIAEGIEVVA